MHVYITWQPGRCDDGLGDVQQRVGTISCCFCCSHTATPTHATTNLFKIHFVQDLGHRVNRPPTHITSDVPSFYCEICNWIRILTYAVQHSQPASQPPIPARILWLSSSRPLYLHVTRGSTTPEITYQTHHHLRPQPKIITFIFVICNTNSNYNHQISIDVHVIGLGFGLKPQI